IEIGRMCVRHQRRKMFKRDGGDEHPQRAARTSEGDAIADLGLDLGDAFVTCTIDQKIEGVMFAGVDGFLRDETAYVVCELAADLAPEMAHRIDEHTLAVREGERKRVVHGCADRVSTEPGATARLSEIETDVARSRFDIG